MCAAFNIDLVSFPAKCVSNTFGDKIFRRRIIQRRVSHTDFRCENAVFYIKNVNYYKIFSSQSSEVANLILSFNSFFLFCLQF